MNLTIEKRPDLLNVWNYQFLFQSSGRNFGLNLLWLVAERLWLNESNGLLVKPESVRHYLRQVVSVERK